MTYTTIDGGQTLGTPVSTFSSAGTINLTFNGITCNATGLICLAVGSADSDAGTLLLAYNSNDGGNTWDAGTQLTLPANSTVANLNAVSGSL